MVTDGRHRRTGDAEGRSAPRPAGRARTAAWRRAAAALGTIAALGAIAACGAARADGPDGSLRPPAPRRAPLLAAAVKVDITPDSPQWLTGYQPRRSTGVLDRIYHRVVALRAGAEEMYLVSSDLCLFSPSLYDSAMRDLEAATGIPAVRVLWTVTHTHAAPEVGPPDMYKALLGRSDHEWDRGYTARVTGALVDAIRTARGQLEPARIAFGTGTSRANINRRAKDVDGTVSLGLNPDGPVDRQINLIRLTRPDGRLVALVANYAMHGTVMSGENLSISGDGPGVVATYVEEKLGAPVLYVNGAAGDIAPIYSVYPSARAGHLSQFRVLLGDRILAAAAAIGAGTGDVALQSAERMVETPRKAGLDWPAELARYAAPGSEAIVRLPIRFVRINDAFIWSAPVELFCEIAMEVAARSPFRQTMYFGYTNGWFGYLPTARAFEEGGYEVRTSAFTPRAERDLVEQVRAFMAGVRRR